MLLRLFLLFTCIPLIELYLLLVLGRHVGVVETIALVLLTGALGAWLARQQGLRTLTQIRQSMNAGQMPTDALIDGLMILIAGAVLLTPGLLTDLAGFFLLLPAGRALIRRGVRRAFEVRVQTFGIGGTGPAGRPQPRVVVLRPDEDREDHYR